MKKYWVTLTSDTFLWIKDRQGLIYKSSNQKSVAFASVGKIADICEQLLITENLYTVELTEKDITTIISWIDSITEINAGYLTQKEMNIKKPITLKPIVKIQDNVKHYTWLHNRGIGGSIIHNLHELTFYINSSLYGSNKKYRQTIFPLKECDELDIKRIIKFIDNAKSSFLSNINIVGNIFTYSNFDMLFEYISKSQIKFTINTTFNDFEKNIKHIVSTEWTDNIQFNILIDCSNEFSIIPLKYLKINVSVTVLLSTDTEYNNIINCFENMSVYCNAKIVPLYNDTNFDFFENNIFISENDLNDISLSKREIFIRQVLNINDFGKLTIMADGNIFANVNMESLGTISDTLYSLIYSEFTSGRSWLRIRDQKPCADCVYQWLCPSPSNYEIVIGKPNLCHIIKN
jgi:pseudo-rSAM protein